MSFVLKNSKVVDEGRALGNRTLQHMRAVIIGGNAICVDYNQDADQAYAGQYFGERVSYAYPHFNGGACVDQKSVCVTASVAWLQYAKGNATPVTDRPEQLKVPAAFAGDRGILVGDAVYMTNARDPQIIRVTKVVAADVDKSGNAGAYIVELTHNIPEGLREAEQIEISLAFPLQDVELESATITEDAVILDDNLELLSVLWTPDGTPAPLPVIRAEIHVSYTLWMRSYADKVYTISNQEELDDIPGALDCPQNHLKRCVALALSNSGGMPVSFIAVETPDDPESWYTAVSRIRGGYSLVPCTRESGPLNAVLDLVERRSSAEAGRECVAWISLPTPSNMLVADAHNSVDMLPLRAQFTSTSEGMRIAAAGSNGRFVQLGVQPGDTVVVHDDDEHAEYAVASVINEDTLLLQDTDIAAPGPDAEFTVWRHVRDADVGVEVVSNSAAAYSNKRVRAIWPSRVISNGRAVESWHACAALAGARSACAPHRSLNGVELVGIHDVEFPWELTETQLDQLEECGVWLLVRRGALVVTRSGVTTSEQSDPAALDESVVSNLDNINKTLRAVLTQTMHAAPADSAGKGRIAQKLRLKLERLATRRVAGIGPQVISGDISVVRQHVFLKDSLVLNVQLNVPRTDVRSSFPSGVKVHQRVIA
jgi:hypothetical protein